MLTLGLIGSVIIVILALYAAHLWRQANTRQQQNQLESEKISTNETQAAEVALKNINMVLKAVAQEQISLTEAAIRIMAYRLTLPEEQQQLAIFIPFNELALATAHIPILDDWKALEKSHRDKLDLEKTELENSFKQEILEATRQYLSKY